MTRAVWRWATVGSVVALVGWEGAAAAQYSAPVDWPEPVGAVEAERDRDPRSATLAVQAGAGVGMLANGTARALSPAGAEWTVRTVLGMTRPLGVELAYVGSRHTVQAEGIPQLKFLENGLEWMARGGYPVFFGRSFVAPYVAAGFGWSYWDHLGTFPRPAPAMPTEPPADAAAPTEEQPPAAPPEFPVQESDIIFKIPVALGISAGWQRLSFDARFTYRHTLDDELLRGLADVGLRSYSFLAVAGYAF